MKTNIQAIFLLAAALLSGCAATARHIGAEGVPAAASTAPVLRSGATTAVLAPEHGARVMSFRPNGHANLLWDNPAENKDLWKWMNYGGEKTWIGPQSLWKDMQDESWPPPLFFDQDAFTVVDRSPTSWTLRSPFDDRWHIAVERTVSLTNDVLYIASRVLVDPSAPPAIPLADLRIWSVAQVPYFPQVSAHLVGEGRYENNLENAGALAEPVRKGDELLFDLTGSGQGKCAMDADSLTVHLPDGRLVVRHCAASSDLGPRPDRCHFFTGQHITITPEEGALYHELEFLSPATETHVVALQFLPKAP